MYVGHAFAPVVEVVGVDGAFSVDLHVLVVVEAEHCAQVAFDGRSKRVEGYPVLDVDVFDA